MVILSVFLLTKDEMTENRYFFKKNCLAKSFSVKKAPSIVIVPRNTIIFCLLIKTSPKTDF